MANLTTGTKYYIRARYKGNSLTSNWSINSSITTNFITRVSVYTDMQKYSQWWGIAALERLDNGALQRYGTSVVTFSENMVLSKTQATKRQNSYGSNLSLDIPSSSNGYCYFAVWSWSSVRHNTEDDTYYYPDATDFNCGFSANGTGYNYYNDDDAGGTRRLAFRIAPNGGGGTWGTLYKGNTNGNNGDPMPGFTSITSFAW